MSRLYPSLDEKFKSEGICPICLMEMGYSPRFSCESDHVICQRCRPYYFNCPQCLQPLHEIPPQSPRPNDSPREFLMSHPTHLPHPHPYPPPSAPSLEEFYEHERHSHWNPQPMSRPSEYSAEGPELLECPYSHLGCTAKYVTALRDMHVSRCQYKLHDESHLTQVNECNPEYAPCRYQSDGCNVRLPHSRLPGHEEMCTYKDREPSPPSSNCGSPSAEDERVPCKYQSVGCNVRLPQWRLHNHEEICIYKDREPSPSSSNCGSPSAEDESVLCKYQSVGCNVRLPHWRLHNHEEICIYKDRELPPSMDHSLPNVDEDRVSCRYQSVGCNVCLPHWRMPGHEEMCIYKDREPSSPSSGCGSPSNEHERVPCKYQSVGCNVRLPHWRLHNHEEICIYKDRLECDQVLVEELGQRLQSSFHIQEDPYRIIDCRYKAFGCNTRIPLWRQEIHESQCNYR